MTLGEKLKMLRASRGLSQEQLAAELNVSRQAVSKWECGDAAPDLDKLRAICTYFAVTTDYLIWGNEEDTPKAAVPEKERALRGRNEVFSDVLLLVLLLAGIAALWNSLRLGFASRAALHIVLAVAAIAAAILSTTIWKQRGRVIALLIAATGAVLALSRLAAMLAYLTVLWSGSRLYAGGGDWPIVWESAGIWLRHDWPYYLFYLDRVYAAVRLIPRGSVATYGQIAAAIGNRRLARVVGYALHVNPEPGVIPCHRVVKRDGEVSSAFAFGGANRQVELLKAEGVGFLDGSHVDMTQFCVRALPLILEE